MVLWESLLFSDFSVLSTLIFHIRTPWLKTTRVLRLMSARRPVPPSRRPSVDTSGVGPAAGSAESESAAGAGPGTLSAAQITEKPRWHRHYAWCRGVRELVKCYFKSDRLRAGFFGKPVSDHSQPASVSCGHLIQLLHELHFESGRLCKKLEH